MNLLIFGASGRTGQELVKQALQQGHQVTAFVRTRGKLKIQNGGLAIIVGDIRDETLIHTSVQGKDAVISALGASSPFKFDQAIVDGIKNIVNAMEQRGIKRFIYMSAINVRESRPAAGLVIRILAPILLRTETAGHEAREEITRQSKLDWTIVRAGGLTNGSHTSIYRSGENIRAKGIAASISRSDVAEFMLKQLIDTGYLRRAVNVMY